MTDMNNYFGKFGRGWIMASALFIVLLVVSNIGAAYKINFLDHPSAILMILLFGVVPSALGFFGLSRFGMWLVSWQTLYILDLLYETFVMHVGARGEESLGPIMLLPLPIFFLIGLVDEIIYRVRLKKQARGATNT